MQLTYQVDELTAIVQPEEVRGHTSQPLTGIAPLKEAVAGQLSFLGSAKYKADVATSKASAILVPADYDGEPAADQCLLLVKNPSAALTQICHRVEQRRWPKPAAGIHPSAVIDPGASIDPAAIVGPLCVIEAGAQIGAGTYLQAQVFVGPDAKIGSDCWLSPMVQINAGCEVRDRVRIHGGVVIGGDGFGYETVEGRHTKIPQVGWVLIESDVEIGANSTVDRGRFSRTVVGEGTKIDNLVQLGHNVVVGKHCILCSQVGIAGSTTLEDYVVLAGQVGVGGHITLGKGMQAGGQAGISSNTEPGAVINGTPAMPLNQERRIAVLKKRLPDLFKRVDALSDSVEELKKTSAH